MKEKKEMSRDEIIKKGNIYKIITVIIFLFTVSPLAVGLFVYIFSSADKPIIYLYPTEETEISVKLNNKENITCSYPKYENGWNVLAEPNGDLTDLDTGRNLYSLYYESKNKKNYKVEKDGFVVEGKDTAKFLEEKLEILGLTEGESEEFIIYWLPKLESNKYNYIRFATEDEIDNNMELDITPKPDSVIRVMMTYKGLNKKIDVEEQKLVTPKRTGFVVVEWGGSEIEKNKFFVNQK